ncbi:unnamed protein product [Linum tenue]|uniref:Glutathione peroxidase n=1 Tax=Linum tenue TaxID=586396 RepID=A0AAV0Q134_9ROSI|nr:unnamed protein product [Linum tenue]
MLRSSIRTLSRQNLIFASASLRAPRHSFSSSLGSSLIVSRFPHHPSRSLNPPPLSLSSSTANSLRFDRAMASNSDSPQSIYDFTVKDARGKDVDLSIYKGKVLMIVNVASQCGLTDSNYTELTQLYQKYKDQGLEILAFPCNQFGSQEPGNNEQIVEFACTRFKAEYPIFDKVEVNGKEAAPIYKFLKSSKGGLFGKWGIFGDDIQWNFGKFLVNKHGQVVDRYYPTTSPLSIEVNNPRIRNSRCSSSLRFSWDSHA